MKIFWNQYKEKLYSALFETAGKTLGGIAIIYFTYTLFPSIGDKDIKNIFSDILKIQDSVSNKKPPLVKEHKIIPEQTDSLK